VIYTLNVLRCVEGHTVVFDLYESLCGLFNQNKNLGAVQLLVVLEEKGVLWCRCSSFFRWECRWKV